MAWTQCEPGRIEFNNYSNIITELYNAINERYLALRYILQNNYSTDVTQSNINEYNGWFINVVVPFNNIYTILYNMYIFLHTFTTRQAPTAAAATQTYFGWCSSPSLSAGAPVGALSTVSAFTGGVGPWFKLSSYTASLDPVYDASYSNIEKCLVDEIIRYINHMYYLFIRTGNSTSSYVYNIYNFYNGSHAGVANFTYGSNAFI